MKNYATCCQKCLHHSVQEVLEFDHLKYLIWVKTQQTFLIIHRNRIFWKFLNFKFKSYKLNISLSSMHHILKKKIWNSAYFNLKFIEIIFFLSSRDHRTDFILWNCEAFMKIYWCKKPFSWQHASNVFYFEMCALYKMYVYTSR